MNSALERETDVSRGEQSLRSPSFIESNPSLSGNIHHMDSSPFGHAQDVGSPKIEDPIHNSSHNQQSTINSNHMESSQELGDTQVVADLNQRQYEQAAPALPQLEQHHRPTGNRPANIENRAHQPPPPNNPQIIHRPPDPYEEEYRVFMDTIASDYSPNEITHGNVINPILAMAIGAKIAQIAATPLHALALMGVPPMVSAGVNLVSKRILGSFRESAGRFLVKMNSFSNRGFFLFRAIDKIVNPLSRKLTNSLILNDGQINQLLRYTRDQNTLNQMTALHSNRLEHLLDIATHAHVLVKTVENSAPPEGVNFGEYQGKYERYRQAAEMAPSLYSRLVYRRQQDREKLWYRAGIRAEMPNRVNRIDQGLWRKGALIGEPLGNLWPAAIGFAAFQLISGNALTTAQALVQDMGNRLDWMVTQVNNWWTQRFIPWVQGIF